MPMAALTTPLRRMASFAQSNQYSYSEKQTITKAKFNKTALLLVTHGT